jgi:hypothetical protein
MGRQSRTKRDRRERTQLDQHKKVGNLLHPPLAQMPGTPSPWRSERLPELIWAALIVTTLERGVALQAFRLVVDYIYRLQEQEKHPDISHTGLSKLDSSLLDRFLDRLLSIEGVAEALAPLILLPELPAYERWTTRLSNASVDPNWEPLMRAVAHTLNHQSQAATDCRWLRVAALFVCGELRFPTEQAEFPEFIAHYPNRGDLTMVRPLIRALEISFPTPVSPWSEQFWSRCFVSTPCWPLALERSANVPETGLTIQSLKIAHSTVVGHCRATTTSTAPDARHDTVFGTALYCLAIADELLRVGNSNTVISRLALRTVVESCITLAYLCHHDVAEQWSSFRTYGAGQAKLASLKLDLSSEKPRYVDLETLEILSNEDMWEEYMSINVGHWDGSNLRQLSQAANVKGVYDHYYSWTSSFVHGQWGALRDTAFDTCGNPLHRLHRIPRETSRQQPDLIPDVADLLDRMFDLVDMAYPTFTFRFR